MKLEVEPIIAALKAKALPVLERDLILVVDTVIANVADQAKAQQGDAVAGIVGLVLTALQPAIDAELRKLLPDAAKA